MYILKNALRCIGRSKGRNILIGIIVLVIATAACIGLSIRQAADDAKENTLNGITITASISYDQDQRLNDISQSMQGFDPQSGERPDFSKFDSFTNNSLSLDEYKVYAQASTVQDFYYISSIYVNGNDSLLPVSADSTSSSEDEAEEETSGFSDDFRPDFQGGGPGGMFPGFDFRQGAIDSDFTLKGFSSDTAMPFVDGSSYVSKGETFAEGTSDFDCVISEELAEYNGFSVGDTITVVNPANEDETYELKIVGLFVDPEAGSSLSSVRAMTNEDVINHIYVSFAALDSIVGLSEDNAVEVTDERTGRVTTSSFTDTFESSLKATYVFADPDGYYAFEEEVSELGLDESYVVNSTDLSSYENSIVPLDTLSSMAGVFLIVILIIGAVILVVLNIFSVRERKYEIGVLTAMGMKKSKVAVQFLTEIFMISIIAVIIGIVIGGVSSLPVSNALLQKQVEAQQAEQIEKSENFGGSEDGMFNGRGQRPGGPGGFNGGFDINSLPEGMKDNMPENITEDKGGFDAVLNKADNYISEVNSAMNLTVVLQMFLIAIGLTLVAGGASVLFIMRYEPLKILANRD